MKLILYLVLLLAAMPLHAGKNKNPRDARSLISWRLVSTGTSYTHWAPSAERAANLSRQDYGSVLLNTLHEIHILPEYDIEEIITVTRLYQTTEGIENDGNLGFWLNTTYQHAEILDAYVLQADGGKAAFDPETIQINTDNTNNLFTDNVYVTLPFSHLKPGSLSVLRYKIVSERQKELMPWSRRFYPARFEPLELFKVTIDWATPELKPLWRTDFTELNCRETATTLSCASTRPIAPFPTDPDMPSAYDILPSLVVTEPVSWKAISERMAKIANSALSTGNIVGDKAEQIKGDSTNPKETFKRLSRFVSQEIRYVGIEQDQGGIRPRSTESTLERRYGDCKDKTMLFVDLARHAGLDVYPVLASTSRMSLDKLLLPSADYFNHMLACVHFNDKHETCVDLTDPDTHGEHLSSNLQGAAALTVGRSTQAPHNLPSETHTWVQRIQGNNELTTDGTVVESLERRYGAHWAAGLRSVLAPKSRTERDRWLLDNYHSVMSAKVVPTIELQGLDKPDETLAIKSVTRFPNSFDSKATRHYREPELWLRNLSSSLKSNNTHYPYLFKGIDYKSEISYRPPPGRKIENVGPRIDYTSPWGSFKRHYQYDSGAVIAYTELNIPRATIPLDQIKQFNYFLDIVRDQNRIDFNIQQTE